MKRLFEKILIGVVICTLSMSAMLMLGAFFFRDRVKALIIAGINTQVTVPVDVAGGIDFSLLHDFPYASLTLRDVSIKNKLNSGPEYLLKVREFSFLFNMLGLVSNKIEITRVHADDGALNLYLDAQGNADYDIFKASSDTSRTSAPLHIDLRRAVVKNVRFTYLGENKLEDIRLNIEKLDLAGNFRSERFDLVAEGQMMIALLRLNGDDYLTEKSFFADITMDVNQKENKFVFNKGNIEIEKNSFDVKGYFISHKKNTFVNFTAETKGKDISKLIALIPVKYTARLAGTEGKGGYAVNASIYGHIRKGVNPVILVNAVLEDADIQIPRVRRPLTHVSAEGYYRLDSVDMDELVVKNFHSEFNGYPQQFSLKLVHLSEPDFILDANGTADLHELRTFFSDSILQNAEGRVTFRDFHAAGSKRDLDHAQNSNLKVSGDFSMKDVEIQTGGITYGNINGNLRYTDKAITVQGLSLNFLNTDFVFDGRITNLLPYAISLNRGTNAADNPLGVDGSLRMKSLNLTNILTAFYKKSNSKKDNARAKTDVRDVFNMQGHLTVTIDKFTYKKMLFENVKADLALSPYNININSLTTRTMGGELTNSGYIAFTTAHEMILDLSLKVDKIDLPVLFGEMDNFGQTTLTDRNLKGRLSADAQIKTVWNNYKDIDLDKLVGSLTCSVLHGELIDFAPIRSASAFIKVEELNHIVFSDLTNQLTIRNRKITIPRMEVQSSAVNLLMSGTHTLDNVIDYEIKVNLRKLLAAKFGRQNTDVAYIEEDPYEGVNLYLRITGDLSNPKIKYDRDAVRKKLKDELASQKDELRGLFQKDGNKKTKGSDEAKREEKYYDTRKKPEFIEFEEDSAKSN